MSGLRSSERAGSPTTVTTLQAPSALLQRLQHDDLQQCKELKKLSCQVQCPRSQPTSSTAVILHPKHTLLRSLSASSFLFQPGCGLISNTNNFLKKEMAPIWTKSPLASPSQLLYFFQPSAHSGTFSSQPLCSSSVGLSISIFSSALLSLGCCLEVSFKSSLNYVCKNKAQTLSGLTRPFRKAL